MVAHVVMFSSGIGSWAAAKRVAAEHGTKDLILLFADVKGDGVCTCKHAWKQHINGAGPCDEYCGCTKFTDDPNVGEDEDNYRFLTEAAENVGGKLVRVADGRTIWQVFHDKRYLGNSRQANCSHLLKQVPCRKWLKENYPDPESAIIYVGIDWSEVHRLPAVEKGHAPYAAKAPMCDAPYMDKDQMLDWARSEGLEPPRLYKLGLPHSNCGGGCVRAGQGQFAKLLENMPERYAVWEQGEQDIRDYLQKPLAIMRDWSAGAVPLTLRTFRERIEEQPSMFDDQDFGGCGCFTSEEMVD